MRRVLAVIVALTLTGAMAALASASSPSPGGTFTDAVGNIAGGSIEAILEADHPQSGDGWEFLECSSPTGTCSYPQTGTARIEIRSSLFPPRYCTSWGLHGCQFWVSQWRFRWFDPEGSQVFPLYGCVDLYDTGTGLISGTTCSLPISDRSPGEYRGELCRIVGSSTTCVETLLEVYFNVTSPAPVCGGRTATIIGTAASETLTGTIGADVIVGLGGDDVIAGLSGNDRVCGGPGNDTVDGGGGRDRLLGEGGNDTLKGQGGDDRLIGGTGADSTNGGPGIDTCVAETETYCEL